MDDREQRLAKNEALFREVNERIEEAAERLTGDEPVGYFCECSNPDCEARIALTIPEYERVRATPQQFVVVPGHGLPDVEHIVERHEDYEVIRKDGQAGRVAEHLDPRGRDGGDG